MASAICLNDAGAIFIAGAYRDSIKFGTKTLQSIGGMDAFVARLDSAGDINWAVRIGGPNNDYINEDFQFGGLAVWRNRLTVSGRFDTSAVLSGVDISDTVSVHTKYDPTFFLGHYSSDGNLIWARSIVGRPGADAADNAVDDQGNLFTTGSYGYARIEFDSINRMDNCGFFGDVFTSKHDTAGNFLWARCGGGEFVDMGRGLAVDHLGNVIVTGDYEPPGIDFGTVALSSGYDIFIAKYDPSGTLMWVRQAGSSGYEHGNAVAVDSVGNIFIAGLLGPSSGFGSTASDNPAIAKYSPGGDLLWTANVDGFVRGVSLAVGPNGAVYISGQMLTPTVGFGSTVLANTYGGSDFFIAKLVEEPTSVGSLQSTQSGLRIYPNPAHSTLSIELPAGSKKVTSIRIRDLAGRIVLRSPAAELLGSPLLVDVLSLPAGLYLLEVAQQDGTILHQNFSIN